MDSNQLQAITLAWQLLNIILLLFLAALIIGAPIVLQIFLSTKKNKWLGLILPVITFLPSLFLLPQVASVAAMLPIFLVLNIPTAVLLIIYAVCRQKYKAKQEIEKMNLQDL